MAVQTITYGDKQYLNENADIPATNKVQDTDMNEIKSVVNNNANELINSNTYSTTEINTGKFWIDGKPIYRITQSQSVASSESSTQAINFTFNDDLDTKMVDWSKSFLRYTTSNNELFVSIHQYYNSSSLFINSYWRDRTTNTFAVDLRGYKAGTVYVTLEYTKTTD